MSAQTIIGQVRELVIAWAGVSGRVWQDEAPKNATFPYVTLVDAISISKVLAGDGRGQRLSRQLQVDLWQRADVEDPTQPASLADYLDGRRIADAIGLRYDSTARLRELDTNIVHWAITLSVRHEPAAS